MIPKIKTVILLIIVLTSHSYGGNVSFIRIDFDKNSRKQVQEIQSLEVDITYYNGKQGFLEAIVSPEQHKALIKMGLNSTPIIDDLGAYVEQLRNEDYFSHFHTVDEMLREMQQIVAEHPGIACLHDIGDSYNKANNLDGYEIWALKISDHVELEDSTEADALFMANMHAREIITPEIIMYFMHYLCDNYSSDPYVTHLVNNRELWLIPTFNPDGHEYVLSGDIAYAGQYGSGDPIIWRKNMRDNDLDGEFNYSSDGVDLNRNFGYQWGFNNRGSSPSPWTDTYRGTAAFSEPESQTIRDFVLSHHFVASLSYHSYGQLWLYPWAYKSTNLSDPGPTVGMPHSQIVCEPSAVKNFSSSKSKRARL